jgi:hypothetical protein
VSAYDAAERVTKGAALLDERVPGWPARIDLSRLDLSDGCRCALGQLWADDAPYYEPYVYGLAALGLDGLDEGGGEYGFCLPISLTASSATSDDLDAAFDELDELWIAEIRRRTGSAA